MATMTVDELRQLKEKAVRHCASLGVTECKWLYRNKSKDYFKNILVNENGIMRPIIKDNSGDQHSPINGRLNGLFFMATHKGGEPPSMSAFGPVRLLIPARDLLIRCPNIYFTDFYCMQSHWHYVTLVVTSKYSMADTFCRKNLLSLSLYDEADNPFLFYRGGQLYVSARPSLHVEVFFTDDIRVFQPHSIACTEESILDTPFQLAPIGAQLKVVPTFGRGSSTPGGLRKNTSCSVCNLQSTKKCVFRSGLAQILVEALGKKIPPGKTKLAVHGGLHDIRTQMITKLSSRRNSYIRMNASTII